MDKTDKIDELMRQIRDMITPYPKEITVTCSYGFWKKIVSKYRGCTTLNKRQRLKRVAMRKGRK